MDTWKFYDVTHRHHIICNPISSGKLSRLVELLRLPRGASVIDIASGKGEFLARLAEAYGVAGVGLDISPYCVRDAEARLRERAPGSGIEFLEMDGASFVPDEPGSYALASCLGASWVFGGHGGTLDALADLVASGGWVVVGEPFWLRAPEDEYLKVSGFGQESFATHAVNAAAGEERGLELVHTLVSSKDDWDRYEGLQWYAASEYARDHPEDPDVSEIVDRVAKDRSLYLRWGRDTVGWAIYIFRQPPRRANT
ncbi:MAG: methyltransferase domain-containing protein [Candidatus Eisenbacteria bacterium]|nr:methyltransferase domain-containing protein [Candidatus Eisenbacteria bacterium]